MSAKQSFCAECPLRLICETQLDPLRPTAEQLAACGDRHLSAYQTLFQHVVHTEAPGIEEEAPDVRRRRLGNAVTALAVATLHVDQSSRQVGNQGIDTPLDEQWSPARSIVVAYGIAIRAAQAAGVTVQAEPTAVH